MIRRYGPRDYVDMAWKNGGGTTRELLKLPHPVDPARFLARLSIATVAEAGPFSRFPGIARSIMLLEGAGMALAVGAAPEVVLDTPWQPFPFPGDAVTDCRLLGGPVRDFNLMLDRACARGELRVLIWSELGPLALEAAEHWLFYGLRGVARIGDAALGPEDCLWLEAEPAPVLQGEPGAAVAAIPLWGFA